MLVCDEGATALWQITPHRSPVGASCKAGAEGGVLLNHSHYLTHIAAGGVVQDIAKSD